MTRNGIILELREDEAFVSLTGAEECESCAAKGSCFTLSSKRKREDKLWLRNEVGAAVGDMVELELAPSASLKVISVTFLVPVLLLVFGYMFASSGSDGQRAVGAAIGLVTGVIIALLVNRKLAASGFTGLTLARIIPREECE